MDVNLFQHLETLFNDATRVFATNNATALIGAIKPIAISGIGVYLTCYSYLILAGRIEQPFQDFLLKMTKIIIIAAFALNTGNYTDWVMSSIDGLQNGLVSTLSSGHDSGQTVYYLLDQTLGKGFDKVQLALNEIDKLDWYNVSGTLYWYAIAGIIIISTCIIVLVGGLIVLSATILLKVVFSIGPLFIMCLFWPMTAKFFDAWFGQVITYTLKIVFVGLVMSIAMSIFDSFLSDTKMNDTINGQNPLFIAAELLLVSYVLYKTVLEIGGLASALGGGVAASALSIGQAVATAVAPIGAAKNIGRTANNLINPTYTKRDMKSGMLTTASRAEHMLSGNSMLNPRYRQMMKNTFTGNWGKADGGGIKNKD